MNNFSIIFENENLIVIDKPTGFLSVPSRFGNKDPRPCLGRELEKLKKTTLFPVHRLDEETSGLILYAKNSRAQKLLNNLFEKRLVQKFYQALTEVPQGDSPQISTYSGQKWVNKILRGKKRTYEADYGDEAITEIVLCEKVCVDNLNLLLWTLKPLTGRSHQLRFQLYHRGFPIIGDSLYGSKIEFPATIFLPKESILNQSIGLRALKLELGNNSEAIKVTTELKIPQNLTVESWHFASSKV